LCNLALPGTLLAGQELLHLEIGDPASRGREVAVVLDGITDTATGEVITPPEMARRLAGAGILFIGENHTDQDFHDVQLRAIQVLHEAGREVLIGLEMYPYTEQAALDDWSAGRIAESGFVDRARWYDHWGYHWNYYREIFLYARGHGIRLYAINSPREVVKAVRVGGFGALTPEQAAHLPPQLAAASDEHRQLYRAAFGAEDALHMNPSALEGLYRAQTLWDATMGWNALRALKAHGGPKAIMVVLIGSGHVTYGLGSERQIAPHYDGRIASLVPVTVVDDDGAPVSRVRASYASFVWGLPEENDPVYPLLGLSLMGAIGPEPGQVIQVGKRSVAARAGVRVGDVLLTLNDNTVDSDKAVRRLMADVRWGDMLRARIRRDDREQDLVIPVRRAAVR
jgi:uncharacterized iron-regulated protein